jgi:hypothetical protein
MIRCSIIATITAATFSLFTTIASATVIPPTGSLVCDASGREQFRPDVPSTPGADDVKLKATGRVEDCDDSAVTGGKAPINGGSITVSATMLKGTVACSNWTAETVEFAKMKATIKLQHSVTLPDGRTRTTTVATLRPVIERMGTTRINGGAGIELFGYIKQNKRGSAPFGNNRFSAVLSATSGAGIACADGTGPVAELTFDNVDLGYSAIFLNAR